MTNTGNLTSAMCLEYLSGKNVHKVGNLFALSGGAVYQRLEKIAVTFRPRIPSVMTGVPTIGEIRGSKSLGKAKRSRYIYLACPFCKDTRWVRMDQHKKNKDLVCFSCAGKKIGISNTGKKRSEETKRLLSLLKRGERSNRWLGGKKRINPKFIKLSSDHKYSCMAQSGGYVLEHRIVMAEHMGRPLGTKEVVHHRNRDPRDNQIENLALLESQSEHVKLHSKEDYNNEMPKV